MLRWTAFVSRPRISRRSVECCGWRILPASSSFHSYSVNDINKLIRRRRRTKPERKGRPLTVDIDLMLHMQELLRMPTSPLYDTFTAAFVERLPSFSMEPTKQKPRANDYVSPQPYRYSDAPMVLALDDLDDTASSVFLTRALPWTQSIFERAFFERPQRRSQPYEFLTMAMQLHQRVVTELYLQVALAQHYHPTHQSDDDDDTRDAIPDVVNKEEEGGSNEVENDDDEEEGNDVENEEQNDIEKEEDEEAEMDAADFFAFFFDVRLVIRIMAVWRHVMHRRYDRPKPRRKDIVYDLQKPLPPKVEEGIHFLLYFSHLSPSKVVFSLKTVAILLPLVVRQRVSTCPKWDMPLLAHDFVQFMKHVMDSPWVQTDALDVYGANSIHIPLLPLNLTSGYLQPQKGEPTVDLYVALCSVWIRSQRPETKQRLLSFFDEMERDGLRPDAALLLQVMPYYQRQQGVKRDMESFLDSLEHNPRRQPDRRTLVDAVMRLAEAQHFQCAYHVIHLLFRIQRANEVQNAYAVSQRRRIVYLAKTLLEEHRERMKAMIHVKFRGAARMAHALVDRLEELGYMEYEGDTATRRALRRTMERIGDLERRPKYKRPQKKKR